jgi:hypothetical protein
MYLFFILYVRYLNMIQAEVILINHNYIYISYKALLQEYE